MVFPNFSVGYGEIFSVPFIPCLRGWPNSFRTSAAELAGISWDETEV